MKKLFILLALTAAFTQANAAKNCAELKSEIAAKLDAAGPKFGHCLLAVELAHQQIHSHPHGLQTFARVRRSRTPTRT